MNLTTNNGQCSGQESTVSSYLHSCALYIWDDYDTQDKVILLSVLSYLYFIFLGIFRFVFVIHFQLLLYTNVDQQYISNHGM